MDNRIWIYYDKTTGEIQTTITDLSILNQLNPDTVAQGLLIDPIPEPEPRIGYSFRLYLNLTDNTLYYKWIETENDEITKLRLLLKMLVVKNVITSDDYKSITGLTYVV